MTSKITLFDHYCAKLIDFTNIPTTPRSWVLNKWGKAEFSIGFDPRQTQSAQLLQERYFQYGNLIHVEHIPAKDENGATKGRLPDWTGIILPPRLWDHGVCHLTAFSAESILSFRAVPFLDKQSGTPRKLFRQLINIASRQASNIQFQIGVLDDLPITLTDDYRLNCYDHILKVVQRSGMNWNVTGEIHNSRLELFANLYLPSGAAFTLDNSNSEPPLDNLNTELKSPLMTEQGAPNNQVFGYSEANTANDRALGIGVNQGAVDDYGPLQLNQVFQGVHDAGGAMRAAQIRADVRGRPAKLFTRTALDQGDTFSHLSVGALASVTDNNAGFSPDGGYGFESKVRILSMDYNDLSNKCPLNIEVL